jgi:diaminohydroxyphosphoribosylaminopyrimidine deaminase/5-amino-6-(5-phosphoribosylamino)uracil reductase
VNAFDADDHHHMVRALELARHGLYSTPPNPAVGCVLVRWGQVVGEGHHQRAGEPHAEVVAAQEAGGASRGSTAYVTLEPCSHHGRTPPCTEALIAAGVRRVVVAMRDPNPRVNGSGLERLEQAGVSTAHGLLAGEAAEVNRGFVRRMLTGRPWVTLKLGASLDGRTALANGTSKWITGDKARADVQRLRARASAIITGSGTVADSKLKGSIDVMIKGSGFSKWKQEDLEITVKPQGRGEYKKDSLNVLGDAGLFLTLNVEGEGPQATFITFKVKSTEETYHSPAFEYTLIKK